MRIILIIGLLLTCFGCNVFAEGDLASLKTHFERIRDLEYAYLTAPDGGKRSLLEDTEHEIERFNASEFGRKMPSVAREERLLLAFRKLKEAHAHNDFASEEKYKIAIESTFKAMGTVGERWYVDGKISASRLIEFIDSYDNERLAEFKNRLTRR